MTIRTLYEVGTGRIIGHLSCPSYLFEVNQANIPSGVGCLWEGEIIEGNIYYYDLANSIILRPTNPATIDKTILTANGVDQATISNLPTPTVVKVNGDTYTVTDGTFEFTIDLPGTYPIIVDSFPYLTKEFEVTAT